MLRLHFLFVVCIYIILVPTTQATDNCTKENFCNGGGVCENGNCKCDLGWTGTGCTENASDAYPAAWNALRSLILISYGISFFVSLAGIIINGREKSSQNSSGFGAFFNVKGVTLVFINLLCLNMILYYSIDPEGFDRNGVPRGVRLTLNGITFPLLATLLLSILFHWADLYNTTTQMLRKEEMLEKINQKYKSDLKLEDVLERLRFVNRLRFPFVLIIIISYVITAIMYALIIAGVSNLTSITYIWGIYFVGLYLMVTIGFSVYGGKLIKILPVTFGTKMKKVTKLTTIQAFVFLICFLLGVIAFFATSALWAFILTYYLLRGAMLFIIITMLSLFVQIQKKFPFIEFTNKSTEGQSSAADSTTVDSV